jgi:YD repeat-containing protein
MYPGARKEQLDVYELTYTYDARGRLVGANTPTEEWTSCTYAGERLQRCTRVQVVVHDVERDASGRITTYLEDGKRQALDYDAKGHVTAVGDHRFVYDGRGSLVAEGPKGDERPVEHDGHDRMTTVGPPASALVYTYAEGRVVSISLRRPEGELLFFSPHDESFAYDAKGGSSCTLSSPNAAMQRRGIVTASRRPIRG